MLTLLKYQMAFMADTPTLESKPFEVLIVLVVGKTFVQLALSSDLYGPRKYKVHLFRRGKRVAA